MSGGAARCLVVAVESTSQRRAFIEFPYRHYAGDPHFVPPLRRDEHRRFDPAHNPFLDHAAMRLWLAMDGGRVVGRVAAIDDRLHNDVHRERVTWFGFFEATDADVARALLDAVEAHAAAIGSTAVRGPVNPSLHEAAGLLIEGFDDDPAILMSYNPPTYAALVEAAGYAKVKDLFAWQLDATRPLPNRLLKIADRVRDRYGITIRTVDLSRFEQELELLKTIYREAWSENWGFVPPTDAEMRQLAVDLKPVVDPEQVLFAEMNGEVVGCAIAIPDINQVLKKMNGHLWPFGFFHFLRRRSTVTRARMMMLGVLRKARRLGLYPLLIAEAKIRGERRGYLRAEMGWTLEDNTLINAGIEAAGGRRSKVYRLYEKSVG